MMNGLSMMYGLKKVNKAEACCKSCKKPLDDGHDYAGGRGLFCGKKCAARKDAEDAAEARKMELIAQALAQPAPSAAGGGGGGMGKTLLWVGLGVLVLVVITIVIIRLRKKG